MAAALWCAGLAACVSTPAERPEKGLKVLIFAGTSCPMSNARIPRLIELASQHPQAEFALVYPNWNESAEEAADHAGRFGWPHAAVKDADHVLADRYGVERVPTAVVLQDGRVRYKGRIDDHKSEEFVKSRDLARVLEELAAGRPVGVPGTPVEGCLVARRARASNEAVTYARDAAPVLNRHCVTCHQPGGAGPVSFADSATASAWAANIKSAVTDGRMPPWKPTSNHGMYHNERRLAKEEIETLARWADAGAPAGDLSAAPAPPIKAGGGWVLGEPDAVLKVETPFEVEAKGRDVYRCYVLRTNFGENKWIAAVEVRVGNPRVVHHIISYLDTLGQAQAKDRADEAPGYKSNGAGPGILPTGTLGGWAPGNFPRRLPEGVAHELPRGAAIVLETHYHKSGRPEVDRGTEIGLYFAKGPVRKQVRYRVIMNRRFTIPAGEAAHEISATWRVGEDVHALDVMPHMHLLGREARVSARLPDGRERDLVSIRDWDFNWQETYQFKEPLPLPRGTVVTHRAVYDNSDRNPVNPSRPPKPARWGEQTTDEMCIAFIGYTLDREDLSR